MPSFDVVSEVNHHELGNGIDQANREVSTRFDFKGTGSNFELAESQITMNTESDFRLQQMYDMLCNKLVKRGVDIVCLELADPVVQLKTAVQVVTVREGIETADSKEMVKLSKEKKIKVKIGSLDDSKLATKMSKTAEELGLKVKEITAEVARQFGYEEGEGVIVIDITRGSPAGRAGFQAGLAILSVNRKPVNTIAEFNEALTETKDSGKFLLEVRNRRYSWYEVLAIE